MLRSSFITSLNRQQKADFNGIDDFCSDFEPQYHQHLSDKENFMAYPKGEVFRISNQSRPNHTYRGVVIGCGRMVVLLSTMR